MRIINSILYNFVIAFLIGSFVTPFACYFALTIAVAAFFLGLALSVYGYKLESNTLNAPTVKVELFTAELIERFRFFGMWLGAIPSEDRYVNNNVIHLNEVGADPDVLINNTTYPITSVARDDQDIPIGLFKYDTTNTKITDDELYALSYDKIGSVVKQHNDVLQYKTAQHGLHQLCPAADSSTTPLVITTGGDNGLGFKRMLIADIATLKLKLDLLEVPQGPGERILVLSAQHTNDLIAVDQSFRDRYILTKTGEPMDFLGFTIFFDSFNPVFNTSNVKKAFGATAAGTDRVASTCIVKSRAFKAKGTTKMYYRIAEQDPENRQTTAGFRQYAIVLHKKTTGSGAIVSVPTS